MTDDEPFSDPLLRPAPSSTRPPGFPSGPPAERGSGSSIHRAAGVGLVSFFAALAVGMVLMLLHEALAIVAIPALVGIGVVAWRNWHYLRNKLAWLWITLGLFVVIGIFAPTPETAASSDGLAPEPTGAPTAAAVTQAIITPVPQPTGTPVPLVLAEPQATAVSAPDPGLSPPERAASGLEAELLALPEPESRAPTMVALFQSAVPNAAATMTDSVLLNLWKGTCLDFEEPVIEGDLQDVVTGLTESYFLLFEISTTPFTRAETAMLVSAAVGTGCPIWFDEVADAVERSFDIAGSAQLVAPRPTDVPAPTDVPQPTVVPLPTVAPARTDSSAERFRVMASERNPALAIGLVEMPDSEIDFLGEGFCDIAAGSSNDEGFSLSVIVANLDVGISQDDLAILATAGLLNYCPSEYQRLFG